MKDMKSRNFPHELKEDLIKTCPFCGFLPNLFTVPDDRYIKGEFNWVVECSLMGCIVSRTSPDRSLKHLIEQWNKRS